MAKKLYIGDPSGNARRAKRLYVGDAQNTARPAVQAYVGDAQGRAQLFYPEYTYAFISVTVESGSIVTCTDGTHTYTSTTDNPVFTIQHAGRYSVSASKNGVASNRVYVDILLDGTTTNVTLRFIRLIITAPQGAVVTATEGQAVRTGTVPMGQTTVTLYMPHTGTWSVEATCMGQSRSASVAISAMQDYTLDLSFFVATIRIVTETGTRVQLARTDTWSLVGEQTVSSTGYVDFIVTVNVGYFVSPTKNGVDGDGGYLARPQSGETYIKNCPFCKAIVSITSGASVTAVSDGGNTITGTSVNDQCILYLNGPDWWTFTATLDGETAQIRQQLPAYQDYPITMSFPMHTFGVEWVYGSGSGTALTRLADAAGIAAPVPAKGTGTGSSPFDSVSPWADMDEYNVVNGSITYRKGSAGFSRTRDTVVKIPRFWYKVELDTANSVHRWYVSNIAQTGYSVHPAFLRGDGVERDAIYIARYVTVEELPGVYQTVTDGVLGTNMTRATARANSAAKGVGWWQYDYTAWCAVWLLYLVEFANWNSQEVVGNGWVSKSGTTPSGGTDSMTYHTGRASETDTYSNIQYRGIEDLWGNVDTWVDGITFQGGQGYVAMNPANFVDDQPGTDAINLGAFATSSGTPNRLSRPSAAPWAYVPSAIGSGRNIPDYYSYGGGAWAVSRGGGNYTASNSAGVVMFETNYGSSGSHPLIGTRLMFLP
jgi:hypothetical protein